MGATGVPEAPGGRGFLYIFSNPWDTVAENNALWEGKEGWTIKWGKY